MTDGNAVSGQQAAQPAPASQGAQPDGKSLSPEIIQVLEGVVGKALDAYTRKEQSIRDKREARITGRVQELEQTFKSLNGGQDLTAEQRSQLRNVAAGQIGTEPPEHAGETTQAPAAQPAPQAETPIDPRQQWIENEFKAVGINTNENDPEVIEFGKKFKPDMGITALSKLVQETIEAYGARLQNKPSNLDPSTASARVSAAVATGSPTNLETQYYAELDKVRGNIDAILQIKTKYRKLGLQVN